MRRVVGVGVTGNHYRTVWQSPDLPAPTIGALIQGRAQAGWILTEEDGVAEIVGVGRYRGLSGDFSARWQSPDLPAPTIMAGTHDEGKPGWVMVAEKGTTGGTAVAPGSGHLTAPSDDPGGSKPPYVLPTMVDVMAVPDNGLRTISTFTGAGGTCLGFRWAGYRTLWASEFVGAARETYEANFPGTPVDGRDIRQVTAEQILELTGLKPGELDVLEGSPPCASFSTAGKRSKHWGQVRTYSDVEQRTDDLFFEYVRLLQGLRPRAFVAENVSGLVKGVAKGYFLEILRALKASGYRVHAKLLDAQWLGVPQQRQRLFFVGIREDLDLDPKDAFPTPLPYRYSVRDALPWVTAASHDTGGSHPADHGLAEKPCSTITVGSRDASCHHFTVDQEVEVRKVSHTEHVGQDVAPTLEGYAIGGEWDHLRQGQGSDRYLNLIRSHTERPCPTVTASGGSGPAGAPGGVASVTHPTQKRKFTIRELRQICGFPPDFELTGSYAQQWERLGRAVPPPMARAVAEALAGVLLHGSVDA